MCCCQNIEIMIIINKIVSRHYHFETQHPRKHSTQKSYENTINYINNANIFVIRWIKSTNYLLIYTILTYTIRNNPNHTTSTKCQYQIKQSCPILFLPKMSPLNIRTQHNINPIVPTVTWNLWNLVKAKKLEPYTPSDMLKLALLYSIYWQYKKITLKIIDKSNPLLASLYSPLTRLWCLHVTVTLELNNRIVFNNGIP